MRGIGAKLAIALAALFTVTATPAMAQATRTWVSGVGDDVNPCSRTAPCKTFAGAISKTAAGGQISVLDPGGFGSVTITKSITLKADGDLGSILASGVTGIIINAAATDRVVIDGLDIDGAGVTPGVTGIRILGAREVIVTNTQIRNFRTGTGAGISLEGATTVTAPGGMEKGTGPLLIGGWWVDIVISHHAKNQSSCAGRNGVSRSQSGRGAAAVV